MSKKFDGARLRALRDAKKLSCRQLGELAGVHWNTVQKTELGKGSPNAETIEKLAKVLECEPGDLFTDSHAPIADANPER